MADANDARDEHSDEASARLRKGLKSCRKVVDSYSAMLRPRQEPAKDRD